MSHSREIKMRKHSSVFPPDQEQPEHGTEKDQMWDGSYCCHLGGIKVSHTQLWKETKLSV